MDFTIITVLLFLCLILSFAEPINNIKKNTIRFGLFACIFSAIYATRDVMKTRDTFEYVNIFNYASMSDGWFAQIDRFEGGYCFLNRLVRLFTSSHVAFFFVISILSFFALFLSLKPGKEEMNNRKFMPLAFISLFTAYYGLLYFSIAIRAGLALALLYWSIRLIHDRKVILPIIIFIASTYIQQSTIFAIPLLLIGFFQSTLSKKTCYGILTIGFVSYIMKVGSLTSTYVEGIMGFLAVRFPDVPLFSWSVHYTEEIRVSEFSFLAVFYYMVIFLLVKTNKKEQVGGYVLYSLIGLMIYTFLGNIPLTIRAAELYLFAVCFALYDRITTIPSNNIIPIKKVGFIAVPTVLFYIFFLRSQAII